jgi:hypothetical protein
MFPPRRWFGGGFYELPSAGRYLGAKWVIVSIHTNLGKVYRSLRKVDKYLNYKSTHPTKVSPPHQSHWPTNIQPVIIHSIFLNDEKMLTNILKNVVSHFWDQ